MTILSKSKIKTFILSNLVGKRLDIRSFREDKDHTIIIVAQDVVTGEIFVLEELLANKSIAISDVKITGSIIKTDNSITKTDIEDIKKELIEDIKKELAGEQKKNVGMRKSIGEMSY